MANRYLEKEYVYTCGIDVDYSNEAGESYWNK